MRFVAVLLICGAGGAFALGLGVGGFGGVAFPTGDMADEEHGDMNASPAFGGKCTLDVTPLFGVEAAVGYHFGHHFKDWEEVPGVEEPSTKVVPITFGANVKYEAGRLGVYAGGGFGYYLGTVGFSGVVTVPVFGDVTYSADTNVNALGFYGGGGVLVKFGRLALDVNPRYHYVLNDGTYDYTVHWNWSGISGSETGSYEKDWNDSYVDIRCGVDYFII